MTERLIRLRLHVCCKHISDGRQLPFCDVEHSSQKDVRLFHVGREVNRPNERVDCFGEPAQSIECYSAGQFELCAFVKRLYPGIHNLECWFEALRSQLFLRCLEIE